MTGLVILLFVSMCVFGAIALNNDWGGSSKRNTLFAILVTVVILGIIGALIFGIGAPASYLSHKSYVAKYEVAKTTINRIPFIDGKIDPRMAAVALKVIEMNQDLVEIKYWNSWAWGILDWFYPDEVVELKLLSLKGQEVKNE